MWTFGIRALKLAAVLSLATSASAQNSTSGNTTAASVFTPPSLDVAFALNVPQGDSEDLYFSIELPVSIQWGAIGLGSSQMAGALILMVYPSADSNNVTMSPRLAYGHSEPVYSPDIQVQMLPGSGFFNATTYVFNGRCSNCRSWSGGGGLDVASRSQSFLWAVGPGGTMSSNDPAQPLRMHYNYGTFTMDMVQATGPGGVPAIPQNNNGTDVGTTLGLAVYAKTDLAAMMHAIIMVFCFVGLFPFGALVLRLGNWVRWHAVNQVLGLIGVITGFGLGISISLRYNRSKNFSNPHQILGLIIFIFLLAQFVLGFMHHRIHKKTEQPTKLAPVHVWMGRVLIALGVTNAFLGFPFAQASYFNYILAGLVIFVFPVIIIILLTKSCIRRRMNRSKAEYGQSEPAGYNLEPWRQQQGEQEVSAVAGAGHSPHFEQSSVGLSMGPAHGNQPSSGRSKRDRKADLGPQQNVTEYV